jgi:L,D-peptidoglycan transpeptidase YkuD (ErfK/YbiS/YcfS/YnhG family)
LVTRADRLTTLPADTRQVVIVYADTATSTVATLETYQKIGDEWRVAFPPMPAWIGSNGFTDHPEEGVPGTPTGVYAFGPTLYGLGPKLTFHYPYHHLVAGDYWNENSDSAGYNTFVHGKNPGGPSEALWLSGRAYTYFAFIAHNVPAAPGKGSGIFLHQSLDKPTAGCVGLSHDDLVTVLTWLDPAASPRIVMGPAQALGRF